MRREGAWGEEIVAGYLKKNKYKITERNWQCRFGEIDLIAEKDGMLCFVEVKTRKSADFAPARAFVDGRKQQKLRAAASLYLAEHPTQLQPRFDVAEVYAPEGENTVKPEISYLVNAF